MEIAFTKYSGCGNDFIIIDNLKGETNHCKKPSVLQWLCHRNKGIGADGVIFLEMDENENDSRYRMCIFQPDGEEVEMCGNGLRCLAHYINKKYPGNAVREIATLNCCLQTEVDGNLVTIEMPVSKDVKSDIYNNKKDTKVGFHVINTGVPHAVIFVDDIEEPMLMDTARQLRYDPQYTPEGFNVNMVKITGSQQLQVRTYERGVEAETLACGTGATAAALVAAEFHGLTSPIEVITRSGEVLTVSFPSPVKLKGPVKEIFKGSFY